jgi:hypothetical protein
MPIKTYTFYGVTGAQISLVYPNSADPTGIVPLCVSPNIDKIEGYYNTAAAGWLHFLDSVGAPATGTVPLRSLYLGAVANGFIWQYIKEMLLVGPLFNGLYIGVSSTSKTFTAVAGTPLDELSVSLEERNFAYPNVQTVGNLSTPSNGVSLTCWPSGVGANPHKILAIRVVPNSLLGDNWVQIWTTPPGGTVSAPYWIGRVPMGPNNGMTVAANATAGKLSGGVYNYVYTYITAAGESAGLQTFGPVTATVNQSVLLSNISPQNPTNNVIARNIYRTKVGGSIYYYVATIPDSVTTTFLDGVADTALTNKTPPTGFSFDFGANGVSPQMMDSTNSNGFLQSTGTVTNGCYVYYSATPYVYTAANGALQANYV